MEVTAELLARVLTGRKVNVIITGFGPGANEYCGVIAYPDELAENLLDELEDAASAAVPGVTSGG
jgi:hypothetical protein